MVVLYEALISVWGSARRVEAELSHPLVWGLICQRVQRRFPDQRDLHVPLRPMRRHHYLYARNRYLTDPDVLAALSAPSPRPRRRPGPRTRPPRPDGPGFVDPPRPVADAPRRRQSHHPPVQGPARRHAASTATTGEILARRATNPTAVSTSKATAKPRGAPSSSSSPRAARHATAAIILDVEWVPNAGGEARTAMDCFTRLAPHVAGAQGVIYDTALRGVHHQTPAARPRTAAHQPGHRRQGQPQDAAPRNDGASRRASYIEDKTITAHDGTRAHARALRARRRARHRRTHRHRRPHLHPAPPHPHPPQPRQERPVPLVQRLPTPRPTTSTRPSPSGCTATTRTRHGSSTAPKTSGPSRPATPTSHGSIPRRNDAESINRNLEDTLWLGRAHSIGHARQHLNLLGYALMVNGSHSTAPPTPTRTQLAA